MTTTEKIEFDIRDVQTKNPKLQGKTPSWMYTTTHKIPRKFKRKLKWWENDKQKSY